MVERRLEAFFKKFENHISLLYPNLYGKLVVIGPDPSLVDLWAIKPHLNQVTGIDIVSRDFGPTLQDKLTIFLDKSPNIRLVRGVTIYEYTRYQDIRREYDTAVFFGAPKHFVTDIHRGDISNLLDTGGTFYGTVNCDADSVSPIGDPNIYMKVISNIADHPIYTGPWCGLIINKG